MSSIVFLINIIKLLLCHIIKKIEKMKRKEKKLMYLGKISECKGVFFNYFKIYIYI